ncbi:cell division cycle-associated protein 2 isoform X2 [Etheostoma cragini]|uniref:cell division cycle-associated protein 2 isoform X2 n=1 Tax=Etheostoma cragini TaxID=417921 RepID=UPI00155E3582|nr:cell division cycle-associated protein 2 isoform X2 [Etheostoma cragini]
MYTMATVEMNTASTEGDQKENASPSEEDSPPVFIDPSDPLKFSELTPCQFGISVQSFIPVSVNSKDKSRLAQIKKARRRSSVGVRGSPETNSLIRFVAQQRMKTPPTFKTPELVRSSPFLPRVSSTLRQKMASFQSLMDVEESEVCDPMPKQDSNTGGCIKTRDYLSDGNGHNGGKENYPPMTTPVPCKRRRLGPREGCEVEIREGSTPISNFRLTEQEEEKEPVTNVVTQGPLPSTETREETKAVLISPTLHTLLELQGCSPAENQQDSLFELQSLGPPPPGDAPGSSSPFHIPSVPSLLEMKPTGEDDSTGTSTVKKTKKRVHFGGPLSPEFFDKNLPPSTPLQKGGTPGRAPTPGGSLQLRSLLKTPQRSESQTPQAQPDPSSPSGFGASPTLAMPRNRRMASVGEDVVEKDGKIVFPSMEEIDSADTRDTGYAWDPQPLNLNTAFNEESLSQILTESETKPSTTYQTDALDEPTSLPEKEKQHGAGVEAPAQSRNQRKKKPGPARACGGEAPAHCSTLKRKQPEESEPVKRSTRSAAKSASGKMKMTSTAAQRWSRSVDRTLYGSRAFASKNPNLSPITETLSLISQSPATLHTPSTSCTAPNHETHLNPEMADGIQAIGNITVTNALEDPSEDSVTSPNSIKESPTGEGRRPAGPRPRGRALQKRKVSVADDILFCEETVDQTGVKTEGSCEDQTTTNPQASRETPLNPAGPEGEVNTQSITQTSADTNCTDSDGKVECHGTLDAPSLDCPPLAFTLSLLAEPAQRKTKRGRRSSVNSSVLQEQGQQAEEHPTNHGVKEKGHPDQAASQQENIRPSCDSQEVGGVAGFDLAPWQADFNFEDVFRPVATRGQRSVRRSLRNKCNAEQSSNSGGLAWLPWTSPESSLEARRKTRGRRLIVAPPIQLPLPEETQDSAS